jgi:hypothetical protein
MSSRRASTPTLTGWFFDTASRISRLFNKLFMQVSDE